MNIILQNNLHYRALQLKLTPNLSPLTGPMREELNYAFEHKLPKAEGTLPTIGAGTSPDRFVGEWVSIKPYHLILKLVAHISGRIFLGLPLCRNPEWLEVSTEFTENGEQLSFPEKSTDLLISYS